MLTISILKQGLKERPREKSPTNVAISKIHFITNTTLLFF